MNVSELVEKAMEKKPFATGAYGSIYKYENKVIKIIRPDKDVGVENMIEIDMMNRMVHPNVMNAEKIEFFENKGEKNIAIIMESADIDLWDLLDLSRLEKSDKKLGIDKPSDETKEKIIIDICKGLAALHSRNILHLDLNPNNILIFGNNAKIADFGLSLLLYDTYRKNDQLLITWTHRPPEINKKTGFYKYSKATDVWALGLLIYSIIFDGQLPFKVDQEKHEDNFHTLKYQKKMLTRIKKRFKNHKFNKPYGELCIQLLDPDFNKRPSMDTVLNILNQEPQVLILTNKQFNYEKITDYSIYHYYAFNALYILCSEMNPRISTLFLAADLYHKTHNIKLGRPLNREYLQRMISCFYLAWKYFEDRICFPEEICEILRNRITKNQLFQTEFIILQHCSIFNFDLCLNSDSIDSLIQRFDNLIHPTLYFHFLPKNTSSSCPITHFIPLFKKTSHSNNTFLTINTFLKTKYLQDQQTINSLP